jgi:predicted dehydrogenase
MTKPRHRVAHLGLGQRGTIHANAFLELSDRYELVGLCELRETRLGEYSAEKGLPASICYSDAQKMLAETKPDLFCFITQPNIPRLMFVELAAKYGIKAIALEKPMATSLAEANQMVRLCREHGIKGVVSHQQKYLTSLQKMKAIVDGGQIGKVSMITASCQAWLAQLGTHFVDYMLWANGFAKAQWVVGHVHGKELLGDHHPSPNYVMGQIGFESGVRAVVEFGRLSASHMDAGKFWVDNRLTVYGDKGYAWGETDGRWGALVDGQLLEGQGDDWGKQEHGRLQPLYLQELAEWLDGKVTDHSCSLEHAYSGYEIMEGLCISAMDNVRVDLPLETRNMYDMFDRMRKELPECPERK